MCMRAGVCMAYSVTVVLHTHNMQRWVAVCVCVCACVCMCVSVCMAHSVTVILHAHVSLLKFLFRASFSVSSCGVEIAHLFAAPQNKEVDQNHVYAVHVRYFLQGCFLKVRSIRCI